jgi:biopolymer transport protein ExbD
MIRDRAIGGRLVQGLRTKYFPKSRINQGLISIGPWINIVILIIMFLMLNSRLVVQPGYTVDLPVSDPGGGARPAMLAVVKHFSAAGGTRAADRIFFADDSFVVGNQKQMDLLRQKVHEAAVSRGESSMLLFAGREISNETLVGIFTILREAGVESVSLAVSQD